MLFHLATCIQGYISHPIRNSNETGKYAHTIMGDFILPYMAGILKISYEYSCYQACLYNPPVHADISNMQSFACL